MLDYDYEKMDENEDFNDFSFEELPVLPDSVKNTVVSNIAPLVGEE